MPPTFPCASGPTSFFLNLGLEGDMYMKNKTENKAIASRMFLIQ
jgi:hypothetical protein